MASAGGNFFRDNDDLLFQFKNGLAWEELAALAEAGYTYPDGHRTFEEAMAFYEAAMEQVGAFSAREVAPRGPRIDARGTWLRDGEVQFPEDLNTIFRGMRELGFFGLSLPRELGGMNGPIALYFMANELLARGDVSVMTHFGMHGGVALSLLQFAAREGALTLDEEGRFVTCRFDGPIREIARGEQFGCMVLTEPGAGSDLGAIAAKAVQRGGRWLLSGEKIFITSGHAQHQLVLARTEGEESGLAGLSLFLVPRTVTRDGKRTANVAITKLEEKLGHHGSATVSLLYDESEGELIGAPGEGFAYMASLMNAARLGVGFEAIGNAEAALRAARAYAAQRVSMGRTIDRHELIAEKLFEMELWVKGLRALAFDAANSAELSSRLELLLSAHPTMSAKARAEERQRAQRHARKARRLTPLLKYLAGERGVGLCLDAMQLFGGMGYIDETGVHKRLRDALVFPIYEGTSQIQALMATKDHLLRTARDPAGFLRRYARAQLAARRGGDPLARELWRAQSLVAGATQTLMLRIVGRKVRADLRQAPQEVAAQEWGRFLTRDFLRRWDLRTDFAPGLLHAERLTRMLGDVAIGKVLVRQAGQHPERRALAEWWLHRMSLRVEALAKELARDDGAVLGWLTSRGVPEPEGMGSGRRAPDGEEVGAVPA